LFELYGGIAGQGPGNDDATRAVLAGISGLPEHPEILDIGCGTGNQTLVLAEATGGLVTAVETHQPFLDELLRRAEARGLSGRVRICNTDMRGLPFAPRSFDLIWSEGAVFRMGFVDALVAWKRFLRPGGYLAVTELCWLTDDPPEDARRFWAGAYPAMKTVQDSIGAAAEAGYELMGTMVLPECAWWEDYYLMMEKRIKVLRHAYAENRAMQAGLDTAETEMDVYRRCSRSYGYAFFVMRRGE